MNASSGKTDAFGREQSALQAGLSSLGLKIGAYPTDVLRENAEKAMTYKIMEIDRNISALKREYRLNGITFEAFQERVERQVQKKNEVRQAFQDL